jgi:undecaprenyl-diphosphatase
MDVIYALKALIMGLVEGFTEFLPISSTGHLILAGSLLEFTGEKAKVFDIAIQSGAMLAVCWVYRARILQVISGLGGDPKARKFIFNLVIAFLPAALVGIFLSGTIKAALFSPVPVATAFVLGGLVIMWVERRNRKHPDLVRIDSIDDMCMADAFKVGIAQAFALIPGVSRSGATIMGAMLFGMSRKASTEFSFFLAIPTLFGASVYSVWKEWHLFSAADVPIFTIGSLAAFFSAFLCVRWLLRYISTHDFTAFAWYRILFGFFVIVSAHFGWVAWVD